MLQTLTRRPELGLFLPPWRAPQVTPIGPLMRWWFAPSTSGAAGTGSAADAAGFTFNYSAAAGSNRVLVCGIGTGHNPNPTVTALSWAGQSFTSIASVYDGGWPGARMYYMKEATIAAGSGTTFSVTTNAAGDHKQTGGFVQMFQDVDQTTSIGTPATNSGTSGTTASVSVTSAAGELVVAFLCSDDETGTSSNIGSGGTSIFSINQIESDLWVTAGYWSGAASVTAQWSQTDNRWAIVGVSLKPVAAGGGGKPSAYYMQQRN